MSYTADHMAWHQRVHQEQIAAYKFLDTVKKLQNIPDIYNYMIDQDQQVRNETQLQSIYKLPMRQSQSRLQSSKSKGLLETLNQTQKLSMQSPRNSNFNKQAYTFGGQTNIAQSPLYDKVVSQEEQQSKIRILPSRAYVKKSRASATGSVKSSSQKYMKTFYPPNYDKINRHMQKLPKIQRFNEDYDAMSVASSQRQQASTKSSLSQLLSRNRSQQILQQINKDYQEQQQIRLQKDEIIPKQEVEKQILENPEQPNEQEEKDEKEEKSELYDDINSLYNMENPKGGEKDDELKSVISLRSSLRPKSAISQKSQVIINDLQKKLEEERSARKKLEDELESMKRMSQEILKHVKNINKN